MHISSLGPGAVPVTKVARMMSVCSVALLGLALFILGLLTLGLLTAGIASAGQRVAAGGHRYHCAEEHGSGHPANQRLYRLHRKRQHHCEQRPHRGD